MENRLHKHWNLISAALLILGAVWIWASRADPTTGAANRLPAPQEGFPAPDFTLESLSGEQITLSERQGDPVLINLWASWCGPCRAEMPDIQEVYDEYKDQGFTVLAVNATNQDRVKDVQAFVDEYHLTFPILLDQSGNVSDQYNLRSLPTSFFITPEGTIHKIVIGGPMQQPTIKNNVRPFLSGVE